MTQVFLATAPRGWLLDRQPEPAAGLARILTIETRDESDTRAFLRKWRADILAKHMDAPLVAALSLALTDGNTNYYRYQPTLAHRYPVGDPYTQGNKRDAFASHGLFAMPLNLARFLLKQPELTRQNALESRWQFAYLDAHLRYVALQWPAEQQDPVRIAMHLYAGPIQVNRLNPFRVAYKENFLEDFIGYFNTATQIIHEQETQNGTSQRADDC